MDHNSEKQFDEYFRKGFDEKLHKIKPEKGEWESLSSRLDHQQGKKNHLSGSWLWVLIPLFLFTQTWTVAQWFQTKKSLDAFIAQTEQQQQQYHTARLTNKVTTTQYDTIFKTIIIEQKIFQSVIQPQKFSTIAEMKSDSGWIREVDRAVGSIQKANISKVYKNDDPRQNKMDDNIRMANMNNQSYDSIQHVNETNSLAQSEPSDNYQKAKDEQRQGYEMTQTQSESPMITPDQAKESVIPSDSDKTKVLKDSTTGRTALISREDITSRKKSPTAFKKFLSNIIPDNDEHAFRLAFAAGSILPLAKGELEIVNPFTVHANAEWLAGKHISIIPSVSYAQYEFEAEQAFLSKLGIPQPENIGTNISFSEADGIQRYIMPSFQLRYRLQPDKIWTWYSGAGVTAFFPLRINLEYDYLDQNLNEITRNVNRFQPANKFAILNLHSGIQYNFSQNASLYADIQTHWDLRKSNQGFHYINPQLGIKFFIK